MADFLLGVVSPWLVTFILIFTLALVIINLPRLAKNYLKLGIAAKILLVLAVALGAYIRFAWVPNMDRIYFDEDRYLSYAVTFARFNKAVSVEAASPTHLVSGKVDTVARITVPVVNGLVFKIFGYSKAYLHIASKVFSSVQPILLFIGVFLLFADAVIAGIASLIFSLLPVTVFWSTSTALDSYFLFFGLLAFVASGWYAKKPSLQSALFLIASTVLLLFVRFESFLFLFVIIATVLMIRSSGKKPLITKTDFKYALLMVPFVLFRALISVSVLGQTWCCGEATPLEVFSPGYFIRNTIPNVSSLFNRPEFPFFITVLAIIALFGKRDRRIIPLGLWAFLYFFLYSFYYAGLFYDVSFSGSYGRYFLMLVPPLVILCSITIKDAFETYKKSATPMRVSFILLGLGLLLSLYQTVRTYRYIVFISSYDYVVDRPARVIQDYLRYTVLPNVPKNSIIIHPLSDWVLMEGRTGIYFGEFLTNKKAVDFVRAEAKRGAPVFMLQTNTCQVNPEKCDKILPYFDLVDYPLKEAHPTGQRLLKLNLKTAVDKKKSSKPPQGSKKIKL